MKFYGHFAVGLLLCAAAFGKATSELSTSWITKEISDHKIKTIDTLLERFTPSTLQSHLLVYGTESQQFADFQSPRVIVYNTDADFIMAFNGEPESEGYYQLEFLKFDHDTSHFIPETINFDPVGKSDPVPDTKPTTCTGCHKTDVRPNWDPYFHWVGFYGSEDDNDNAEKSEEKITKGRELDEFKKFEKKKAWQVAQKKGRYRFLLKSLAPRPNLEFNDRITCLNSKRVLRAFAEHRLSGRLLPAIATGSLDLERIPSDLIDPSARSFAQVKRETIEIMEGAMERRLVRHTELLGEGPRGRVRFNRKPLKKGFFSYESLMPGDWRYIFEEHLGISFAPFSTSFHSDYHLNLSAPHYMGTLLSGATVDKKTGRVVLSRKPNSRVKDSYRYTCPRTPSVNDLPFVERMGPRLVRPD